MRGDSGQIISRIETGGTPGAYEPPPFGGRRTRERDRRHRGFDVEQYIASQRGRREPGDRPGNGASRLSQPLSIFPYGVSRSYLEQSVRELHLPVRIQHHVEDSDIVLTLKNYYRRKDSPVRVAESSGIPIEVLRSNTVSQIKGALARVYGVETADTTDSAMQEAREGIDRARQLGAEVELSPQNAHVRRLQHQLVEEHEMAARSQGEEPHRHLVILGPTEA